MSGEQVTCNMHSLFLFFFHYLKDHKRKLTEYVFPLWKKKQNRSNICFHICSYEMFRKNYKKIISQFLAVERIQFAQD